MMPPTIHRFQIHSDRHPHLFPGIRPEPIPVQELRVRRPPAEEGPSQTGRLQSLLASHRLTPLRLGRAQADAAGQPSGL